jgi:transmembrane sensor
MTEEPASTGKNLESDDIHSIVADWHNRLEEGELSPVERAEFDAWLAADPRHGEAFDAIDRLLTTMGAARADPRILELRRNAVSATRRSVPLRRFAAAIVVLAVFAGAASLMWPELSQIRSAGLPRGAVEPIEGGSHHTSLGERAEITLSDGSSVFLNTSSDVDIRFTPGERRVRLLSGQAWFHVAPNPTRPFIVEAANQRVIAIGTEFDVRIDEHQKTVQVALAEGRVLVEPIHLPGVAFMKKEAQREELVPGEALIASREGPVNKRKADVARITSWRKGQVVFDDDTLETAVAEINRYSATQIKLADPAIGAYRVSGVFKAGNSESFIETVTGHYPIRVSERTGGIVVLVPVSREETL